MWTTPSTLLEGNVDTAEKGASSEFRQIFEEEVMGNPLYGAGTEKIKNSTATKQKDFNHNWKEYGAVSLMFLFKYCIFIQLTELVVIRNRSQQHKGVANVVSPVNAYTF